MSEFVAITTQEEFDARISERLKRERESVTKRVEEQFSGHISKEEHEKALAVLQGQIDEAAAKVKTGTQTIEALEAKVQKYESDSVKTRIAQEYQLPYGMAERLNGDNEEAIRKDAEALHKMLGVVKANAPAAMSEPTSGAGSEEAAYKSLLQSMRTQEV